MVEESKETSSEANEIMRQEAEVAWSRVVAEEVVLSDLILDVFWRWSQEDFLMDWMSAVGFPVSFPQG